MNIIWKTSNLVALNVNAIFVYSKLLASKVLKCLTHAFEGGIWNFDLVFLSKLIVLSAPHMTVWTAKASNNAFPHLGLKFSVAAAIRDLTSLQILHVCRSLYFLMARFERVPTCPPPATPLRRLAKRFRLQSRLFRSFRVPFSTLLTFFGLLFGSQAPCFFLANLGKLQHSRMTM